MTDEEFAQYFAWKHELPGVEFKGPGLLTDQPLQAKVVRAALGMANRRGGGHIIIGVEEKSGAIVQMGLDEKQAASWSHYDNVKDIFSAYADPPIHFDLELHQYDGNQLILLIVYEFEDLPVLCKKHFIDKSILEPREKHVLRDGACYVRPRRKHETSEIPTAVDMRDILDLAIEKGVARFVAQSRAAGLSISTSSKGETNTALFFKERQDWDSEHIASIRSRGYWEVIIRPEQYSERLIKDLPTLSQVFERSFASIREWNFPYLDSNKRIMRGARWIGQESDKHDMEAWRFYLSGQLLDLFGYGDDWLDVYVPSLAHRNWKVGQSISVEEVLFRFTEIFEVAKRLSLAESYQAGRNIWIEATLYGLRKRILSRADIRSEFRKSYQYDEDTFATTRLYSSEEVIAEPWNLAREAAMEFFQSFGWNPNDELLRELQLQLS